MQRIEDSAGSKIAPLNLIAFGYLSSRCLLCLVMDYSPDLQML